MDGIRAELQEPEVELSRERKLSSSLRESSS